LSALDAHVGKAVFQNVLYPNSSGKTRILVTHALHFLPQVDYIYTVVEGRIAERGTYSELMANDGEFSKFITEFGSKVDEKEKDENENDDEKKPDFDRTAVAGAGIMQAEERNTGSVNREVYRKYISAGKGEIAIPLLLLALALTQGSTVMGSYWYVSWRSRPLCSLSVPLGSCIGKKSMAMTTFDGALANIIFVANGINLKDSMYVPSCYLMFLADVLLQMAIYAAFGVGQAVSMFLIGSSFALLTFFASQRLHKVSVLSSLLVCVFTMCIL
jgi:hypothetical protein